jgi:hypothetical protein
MDAGMERSVVAVEEAHDPYRFGMGCAAAVGWSHQPTDLGKLENRLEIHCGRIKNFCNVLCQTATLTGRNKGGSSD